MSEQERWRADLMAATLNDLIAAVYIHAHDQTLSHSQRLVFIKAAAGKAQLRYRELTQGDD